MKIFITFPQFKYMKKISKLILITCLYIFSILIIEKNKLLAAVIVNSSIFLEFIQQKMHTNSNTNVINRNFISKYFANTDQVIITFDDGPHPIYTPQILKILREYNIKAIFFVLGMNAQKYPHLVKQIHDEGHIIGNHTWYHINLKKFPYERIRKEIVETNELIKSITGYKPKLFRPPYGAFNKAVLDVLKEEQMALILWSFDPRDWKYSSNKAINTLQYQMNRSKYGKGGVILLHDVHYSTIKLLQQIITTIEDIYNNDEFENKGISKLEITHLKTPIRSFKCEYLLYQNNVKQTSSNVNIDSKMNFANAKNYWNTTQIIYIKKNNEEFTPNTTLMTKCICLQNLPNKYLLSILRGCGKNSNNSIIEKDLDKSNNSYAIKSFIFYNKNILLDRKTIEIYKASKSAQLYSYLMTNFCN